MSRVCGICGGLIPAESPPKTKYCSVACVKEQHRRATEKRRERKRKAHGGIAKPSDAWRSPLEELCAFPDHTPEGAAEFWESYARASVGGRKDGRVVYEDVVKYP